MTYPPPIPVTRETARELVLTSKLSLLAAQLGFDLTPLASREQAFADMIANARKFDGSYEAAKARFEGQDNGKAER